MTDTIPIAPAPTIPVSEVYGPVIQGEGMVIGRPTIFLRLGGCDYECSWCDSLYAVLPKFKSEWQPMGPMKILQEIAKLAPSPMLITLSGGNPALHRLTSLIEAGHAVGYTFAIETQGSRLPDWATMLDHVTLSPKPPSSLMKTDWGKLERWLTRTAEFGIETCLKVVVFDEVDYAYARDVRELAQKYEVPLYLQAGTSNPYSQTETHEGMSIFRAAILERTDWLGQKAIHDGWSDVRVLPQLHALLYGAKRGV